MINYQHVNVHTIPDVTLLPDISEAIRKVRKAKYLYSMPLPVTINMQLNRSTAVYAL